MHNTLVAAGPSFKAATVVTTPSGNVDVAPTVAYLIGGTLPQADGRVLYESLVSAQNPNQIVQTVTPSVVNPAAPATGIVFESPVDPTGATKDTALGAGTYTIHLAVKDLTQDGKTYRYFDHAKAVRQ